MGSKGIVIFGIFLAMVLFISSEVVARELAETSNTIDTSKEDKKVNGDNRHAMTGPEPLNPNRPFCNRKVYGRCLPRPSRPIYKRKCKYKRLCGRGPPPSEDAKSTETVVGGEKTDAEVEAKPHN